MAGLSGTGRLADDLYLIAHNDISGKPLLQPRALGIGLAGGLLAELMLPGAIRLSRGTVIAAAGKPPGDPLARSVLSLVASESNLPARDLLLYLARNAAQDIGQRLEQAGYLARAGGWRLRRSPRWVPVDADSAFAPLVRVKAAALSAHGPEASQHLLLGGLAAACGLGHQLALYLPAGAGGQLEDATPRLDPAGQPLIAQTRAARDSALLSHPG